MKKLIPVIIFLLYWFLFPISIKEEFVPELISSSVVQHGFVSGSGQDPLLAFSGPAVSGYVNDAGRVIFSIESDEFVRAAGGYCLYSDSPGNFNLAGINGSVISSFSLDGVPYFLETGLYLLSHDARGFSVYTKAGLPVWHRYFSVPITVFSTSSKITVIGLASGDLFILDDKGNIVFEKRFDYPDLDCIYGISVSPDNRRIAVIHGGNPQFLHVLEKSGDKGYDYSDLLRMELDSEFRSDVFLTFSGDSSTLAYETPDGAAFYSFRNKKPSAITTKGSIDSGVLSADGLFFFFSADFSGKKKFFYADLENSDIYPGSGSHDFISLSINENRLLVLTSDAAVPDYSDGEPMTVYNDKVYLYGLEMK